MKLNDFAPSPIGQLRNTDARPSFATRCQIINNIMKSLIPFFVISLLAACTLDFADESTEVKTPKTEVVMRNGDRFFLDSNLSEFSRFIVDSSGNKKGYRFHWESSTGSFIIYKINGSEATEVAVATFWDSETDQALGLGEKSIDAADQAREN
jgi:hypothetical protein